VRRRALIVIGVIAFLAVSFELARYLTAASAERDDVYALIKDQARGDAKAMLARRHDCDAACASTIATNAAKLRRAGTPKILKYDSPTAYSLSTKTDRARVAWEVVDNDGLPVVQCVTVTRSWSFISGASVTLRRLSAPIGNEAGC